MNLSKQANAAYQTAIMTTPPLVRVVLLYDGILVRIAAAAAAARRKDYETQFTEVMRAAKIVNGLNRYLDMEAGGKVARSLRDMYQAVAKALLSSVGRSTGAEALDKVGAAVRTTRNAWAEIAGLPISPPPGN
jgi:flagellar secretion chaperone FliS